MKRILEWESFQHIGQHERRWNTRQLKSLQEFRLVTNKMRRNCNPREGQCSECGAEVKVFVSRKRNPHSSKLGRAVSMKDHDLCRRCWRRLMHQQRHAGIFTLPLSLFIGGRKLHPRLLIPIATSSQMEAS